MADKNDNYIGIAMGLDVTDLKQGLQETRQAITTANKEFNHATAGMDKWTDSTEGLQAKLTQLDVTIEQQKKVVAGYRAELEHVKQKFGENSEQVRRMRDRLLDAETAVKRSERSHRHYSNRLSEVKERTEATASATGGLAGAFKSADKGTKSLGEGFTVLKGVLAGFVVTGVKSLVGGIKNAISSSRTFRRELAYLESGAKRSGVGFEHAKEILREVASITEDTSSAVKGINNLMEAGLSGDALDKITDELLGASIVWKDTLNFDRLAQGLQKTLEMGTAQGQFQDLLQRAGVDIKRFNYEMFMATTQADKQNYALGVLSRLGLKEVKDAYVESNRTLIEGARANFDYSEAMADVGDKAEPTFNTIRQGWADVLSAFLNTQDEMDLEGLNQAIKDAFTWFIEEAIPRIRQGLDFIARNLNIIKPLVIGIGLAWLSWKVYGILTSVAGGIKGLITTMRMLSYTTVGSTASLIANKIALGASAVATNIMAGAQAILNAVMSLNPIMLIVIAIGLLVAALATLYMKSDWFRKKWQEAWDSIFKVAKQVLDWIIRVFTSLYDELSKIFSGIWDSLKSIFAGVGNFFGGIVDSIVGFFSKAWDGIKNAFAGVSEFFTNLVAKIVGFFTSLPSKLFDIGKDLMQGLIDGVKSMIDNVKKAVTDAVDRAISGVKNFLGISSPSKLMRDEIGKMMGEGVGAGILASTDGVMKDAKTFAKRIGGGLTGVMVDNPLATGTGGGVTNNYYQTINAPKMPSRIELYRQTRNLLDYKGGGY